MENKVNNSITFTFCQKQIHLQKLFFSYSSTLLTDWSINTSWTKFTPWKCRLKTNLTHVFSAISPSRWPKTSKRTCFSMMERSPTVATSAATQPSKLLIWKATCWFTVERNLLFANSATTPPQKPVPSKDTCEPIREKNLSVQLLLLYASWWPQDAHVHPFGNEAFHLHTLQLLLHASW